jgi:UDP-N-acetylmuramoylalanine--D-glutamate ligase
VNLRLAELAGRRVGLWGFGREGRATLAALEERGIEPSAVVAHTDGEHDDDARAAAARVSGFTVTLVQGAEGLVELANCELIVRSPGVSIHRDDYKRIVENRLATTGTNLWLAELPEDVRAVGVTGTKGKSTTASLIAHLARAAGAEVTLAGNIGVPLLATPVPAPGSIAVLELSSFQIADLAVPVWLAVVTNVYREHLDWHVTEHNYRSEKLRLALPSMSSRVVLDSESDQAQLGATRSGVFWVGPDGFDVTASGDVIAPDGRGLVTAADMPLVGGHNARNVATALAACHALGLEIADPAAALRDFEPLPHRLQPLETSDSRLWVNDSISTTPESTIAALDTYGDREVTLIVGGFDRDQDFGELCRRVMSSTKPLRVIGVPDTGTRILAQAGGGAMGVGHISLHPASGLEQAVDLAAEVTPAHGVVLLSPAAPSFGAFRDFEERGERFSELARRAAAAS